MATTVTSDNFNDYFIDAMEEYGKAQESETDVPTVTGADVASVITGFPGQNRVVL